MKKIILIISLLFLTTGCSYQEINDLAIASAMGIDLKDDDYILTAQIMNIQKSSDGSMIPDSTIYTSKGKTVSEALRNFTVQYPKNIYLGHTELIVLGKDLIEKKMENALDFILRSPYANEFATIIANKDGSAAEILNPDIEKKGVFPTDEIISTIEQTTKKHGTIKKINAVEFFSEYIEEGIDPLIPIIKYEKSKKSDDKSSSILTGMASFKKNVINEELDKEELVAYNTINNNYYDIVDVIDYKKTSLSVILFNPKSKLEVKLKNNNIEVNIKTTLEARIGESHTNTEIENKKVINEITKETEKNIQRKINKLLDYCKKYNVDLLGIKNQIYKKYNNQYKNYKNKNIYEEAKFNTDITVNMYRFGSIYTGNLGGHNE